MLEKIFGNAAGEAIAKPVEAVGNVLDKLFTSDDERLDKALLKERLLQQPQLAQVELNKIEAASTGNFKGGWRPFIGWICGICLGIYFIPQFILADYLWVKMCLSQSKLVPFPIEPKALMELLWALLGLGAYRTVEKVLGKTK